MSILIKRAPVVENTQSRCCIPSWGFKRSVTKVQIIPTTSSDDASASMKTQATAKKYITPRDSDIPYPPPKYTTESPNPAYVFDFTLALA